MLVDLGTRAERNMYLARSSRAHLGSLESDRSDDALSSCTMIY